MNDISTSDVVRNLFDGAMWTLGLVLARLCSRRPLGFWRCSSRESPSAPGCAAWRKAISRFFRERRWLMQLFIIFFGSSLIGLELSPWVAAALGLTLFYQRLPR